MGSKQLPDDPVIPVLVAGFLLPCALALMPLDGWAADGRQIAAAKCASCHGPDGASGEPDVPRIAGLQPAYIARQSKEFADGRRRNEDMAQLGAALGEDEVRAVAAWYGGRKMPPGKAGEPGLAEAGRQIYEDGNGDPAVQPCAVCHQSDGAGNARFPWLAGQHKPYIVKQLGEFKSGRRATDPQMADIAKRLSAQEIRAQAEYIGGL